MTIPKILILEDSKTIVADFRNQFSGEPVEVVIAETAAEARELFERDGFDIIVLDGIVPSEPGHGASLQGPPLADEFRKKGFLGPIIGTSSNPEVQSLTKEWANRIVASKAYTCDKRKLARLIRELLGLWPTTPA